MLRVLHSVITQPDNLKQKIYFQIVCTRQFFAREWCMRLDRSHYMTWVRYMRDDREKGRGIYCSHHAFSLRISSNSASVKSHSIPNSSPISLAVFPCKLWIKSRVLRLTLSVSHALSHCLTSARMGQGKVGGVKKGGGAYVDHACHRLAAHLQKALHVERVGGIDQLVERLVVLLQGIDWVSEYNDQRSSKWKGWKERQRL